MAKKKVTQRESMRNLTFSTLESKLIQGTLGSNLVQSDPFKYGQIGKDAGENYASGKDFQEEKQRRYEQESAEYESLGVFGEADYPSNKVASHKILLGLNQLMETSYLGDLYDFVKEMAPSFAPTSKHELPNELREYTHIDLIRKATEEKGGKIVINPKKLSKEEQTALDWYESLKVAYRDTAAIKMGTSNYLSDINAQLEKVNEDYYKSKEKK